MALYYQVFTVAFNMDSTNGKKSKPGSRRSPNFTTARKGRTTGKGLYQSHNFFRMKRLFKELGSRALDGRTAIVKDRAEWIADSVRDLGGAENVSTFAMTTLDAAATTRLFILSLDAFLLRQSSLVNKRKRALYPMVIQRQQLVDSLARLLGQLGLEKKMPPAMTLPEYLRLRESDKVGRPGRRPGARGGRRPRGGSDS